ncbi:hypothetical protein [Streptomyces lonarensis]|uniref:Lipoprotein n=1 Tax=Streptomyces lonarensis TaxID=700599 RepID=A0A7X6HXF4_9ACTN|nr:hypothetical protein [Streptomyces lonarensis]NJQ04124.1 hypothetical protein [Streptomyces lonarensis]
MKSRLVLSVAVATTAGLLLSACSGGGSGAADDVKGAEVSSPSEDDMSKERESEDAEGDEGYSAEDVDRPKIELPGDMTKEFEDVDTDDPTERAVLADQAQYASAVDAAIAAGEVGPALDFYATGEGYADALELVTGFHEDGYRVAGATRYYNRSVTLRDERVATSSYCVDFSHAYSVDVETGEEFPDGDEQGLYSFRQVLNDSGVWQVEAWRAASGGEACD